MPIKDSPLVTWLGRSRTWLRLLILTLNRSRLSELLFILFYVVHFYVTYLSWMLMYTFVFTVYLGRAVQIFVLASLRSLDNEGQNRTCINASMEASWKDLCRATGKIFPWLQQEEWVGSAGFCTLFFRLQTTIKPLLTSLFLWTGFSFQYLFRISSGSCLHSWKWSPGEWLPSCSQGAQ